MPRLARSKDKEVLLRIISSHRQILGGGRVVRGDWPGHWHRFRNVDVSARHSLLAQRESRDRRDPKSRATPVAPNRKPRHGTDEGIGLVPPHPAAKGSTTMHADWCIGLFSGGLMIDCFRVYGNGGRSKIAYCGR